MTIKAILFDMDGVLIDAREWHFHALNDALAHFGFNISRESHLTTYDGLPTKIKLDMLSKTHHLPVGLHTLINSLKQKYTIQYSYNHCRPKFNHRKALSRLSLKYKIAICSNSVRNTIETMMDLSNLNSYLDLIISNQDVSKPKPDPEMYLTAMNKLNLKPKECLIIEDNDHGVQAAIASGGHLLRVSTPDDITLERIQEHLLLIDN